MAIDILPDSRTGRIIGGIKIRGIESRPVYCANCGKPEGYVPVGMTYAFFLCDPCAGKYGNDAHFMREPDEKFFARARELQAEEEYKLTKINPLAETVVFTQEFLSKMLANPNSKFSKLKKDFDKHLRNFSNR